MSNLTIMAKRRQTAAGQSEWWWTRVGCMRSRSMRDHESVSRWIAELKSGAEDAATNIWGHFYARMLAIARRKLSGAQIAVADEEDVVARAFWSFFRRARNAEFPSLQDRNDLWQLLSTITVRKALNQRRDLTRLKRGGPESAGSHMQDSTSVEDIQSLEPSPENALIASETLEQLLEPLDPELRRIAILRLEGFSVAEIATSISRSVPTVERRLRLIRDKWAEGKF